MKSPLNTPFKLAAAIGVFANPAIAAITMDYVNVLNPGNTADTSGYGAVADPYRIGTYEVTNTQYVAFLNAVAATDTNGLYNTNMGSNGASGGITRTGTSGSYTYAVKAGMGDRPVTYVSWMDAARFVNWIHNGQPTGSQGPATTEDGAYTLNLGNVNTYTKKSGATVWLPTENEWYKAAYYDPNKNGPGSGGYWTQATQSNTIAGNTVGTADSANYTISGSTGTGASTIKTTTFGAYGINSTSAYGTYDQAGNVTELTSSTNVSSWVTRGGAYTATSTTSISSAARGSSNPTNETNLIGFRIAAVIPEPSTAILSFLAIGGSLLRRNRRAN